ncbi:MAG: serine hydrolase [Candidatus Neomarinimicrobiota bacterium]
MKKALLIVFSILLVLFIGVAIYISPLMPIITGYAAKAMTSSVFLSGRAQEDVEAVDLNFSFIKYNKNIVDMEKKTVKSRFLWYTSKAVFDEQYGATLVKKYDEAEILARPIIDYESTTELDYSKLWPEGDQVITRIHRNVDYAALSQAYENAFSNEIPYYGTRALLVVHEGELIAEDYAEGFDSQTRLLSWSIAKSVTNAMVGILVKEGKVDIYDPILMTAWENTEKAKITWNDLMHMCSGLEWEENYGNESDVNVMLHKTGDFGIYTANKKVESAPNEVWEYSSGSTNIISYKIRELFENDLDYYNFPYDELFSKINIKSAVFETDPSGTFVGSSYLYATARDYARFGLLYLNDGVWQNERILPEGWVDYTRTPVEASDGKYGAFFWTNNSKQMPDAPADTYFCQGYDGQWIMIVPSKELVVVRLGDSTKQEYDRNIMMKEIMLAFPG